MADSALRTLRKRNCVIRATVSEHAQTPWSWWSKPPIARVRAALFSQKRRPAARRMDDERALMAGRRRVELDGGDRWGYLGWTTVPVGVVSATSPKSTRWLAGAGAGCNRWLPGP